MKCERDHANVSVGLYSVFHAIGSATEGSTSVWTQSVVSQNSVETPLLWLVV